MQFYENLNDEHEEKKDLVIFKFDQNTDYNLPYDQMGQWHKASRVDR